MLKKIKKKLLIIILLFGIIISIIYSNIYWKNYEKEVAYQKFEAGIFSKDENALYIEGSYVGSRILGGKDVYLYFITAEEILRSFKKNKNFFTSQPEFKLSFDPLSRLGHNGKFWNTGTSMTNAFNDHVIKHALDWVGNYTETYFELNCLVVDTKNVVMLSENLPLAEELSKRGITVHWVPFRARRFWDGAMHCVTVDIRRDSRAVDYFPERHTIHTRI